MNRTEIEREVIGAVIANPREFTAYSRALNPEFFSDPVCRDIIGICHKLSTRGIEINPTNLIAECGIESVVYDLAMHNGGHLGLLVKKLAESNVLVAGEALRRRIGSADDPFVVLDAVTKAYNSMRVVLSAHERRSKQSIIDTYLAYLEKMRRGDLVRIPTGFAKLDRMLRGGLPLGDITFCGGSPGAGKTSFMLKVGANAARHCPVEYINGEMPSEQLLGRYVSQGLKLSQDVIEAGQVPDEVARMMNEFLNSDFGIDSGVERTTFTLMGRISDAINRGIKLVMVDYMQVFVQKGVKDNEFSQIKALSEMIRGAALMGGIHVFVASSLNRIEATAQRLTLNSFYGGSQLGHDCAVGLILYSNPDDRIDGSTRRVHLDVVKARNASTGEVPIIFNLPTQDMSEEDDVHVSTNNEIGARYERDDEAEPF